MRRSPDPTSGRTESGARSPAAGPDGGSAVLPGGAVPPGGRPLPTDLRERFEAGVGRDLGEVRVHTGRDADALARHVGARAYTLGTDVVFADGAWSPGSREGERLLAHELAHVVQQDTDGGTPTLRRTIGDGHDLGSPRFTGDPILEACYDGERVLRHGARGDAVVRVQHALLDAGMALPLHGIDGDFGDETRQAVEDFQTANGLTGAEVDGVVGPVTMELLDRRFPAVTTTLPSGAWTRGCVLDVLCEWNEPVVDQLRSTVVKTFDDIFWEDPYYDGSSWTTRRFDGGGYADRTVPEIGMLTSPDCGEAADTLYHEVFHQNQPGGQTTLERETGAYRFTEAWLIDRGLPGRSSFRRTDPRTGRTTVDVAAVESFVRSEYPGPSASSAPGEEVVGRTLSGDTIVERPDGSTYTRPPQTGDSYPGRLQVVNEQTLDPAGWVCP